MESIGLVSKVWHVKLEVQIDMAINKQAQTACISHKIQV